MSDAQTTRDHGKIRRWAEARDGHPARVRGTGKGEGDGLLRIDFGTPEESLEKLDWDEFFAVFDDRGLQFLYQDKTADGKTSRFCKFVDAA